MNKERLEQVKQLILDEPKRLDMDVIGVRAQVWFNDKKERPRCGTVGCIAGWGALVALGEGTWQAMTPDERALRMSWGNGQDALELTDEEAGRLFREPKIALSPREVVRYQGYVWPKDLAREHEDAKTPEQRANVTARRIDRFNETEGKE